MSKAKAATRRMEIVSVQLSPATKKQLDAVCEERGMTIKHLLGRLLDRFHAADKTEQTIILGQIEDADVERLAGMLLRRGSQSARPARKPRKK